MVREFKAGQVQEEWKNTQVLNGSGTIAAKNQEIKSVVGQEIQHWMNEAEKTNACEHRIFLCHNQRTYDMRASHRRGGFRGYPAVYSGWRGAGQVRELDNFHVR